MLDNIVRDIWLNDVLSFFQQLCLYMINFFEDDEHKNIWFKKNKNELPINDERSH